MTEPFIVNLLSVDGLITLAKIAVVIIEVVYLLFAFLLTREVHIMNRSFKTSAGFLFSLLAYAHLLAMFGVLLISITLL